MNSDYLYKVIKRSLLKLQAKANQNEINREKLIPYIKTYQKDLTILKRKKRTTNPSELTSEHLATLYQNQATVVDNEVLKMMKKTEMIIHDLAKRPRRDRYVKY